jgi:hypothetical protein
MRGGWNVRRDERFAELIDKGLLAEGGTLANSGPINPVIATVSNDYGISVEGPATKSPTSQPSRPPTSKAGSTD